MSPEEVSGFRRRAFRVFYFRLSSIGKILREIRVCRLFKLLTFIKWINFKKRR
jgi:hypothetical protein